MQYAINNDAARTCVALSWYNEEQFAALNVINICFGLPLFGPGMFPLEEENVNAPVPPLLGYMTALFIVPVIFGNCPFVVVPMYDPAVPATTLPSVNVGKLNVGLFYIFSFIC